MRKLLIVSSFLVCIMLAGSCDFVRKVAGRPTSVEIAAKKEYIQKKAELERQAVQDSINRALAESKLEEEADSAYVNPEVVKRILESGRKVQPSEKIRFYRQGSLANGIYLVIGAFRETRNIDALVRTISDAGYSAVAVPASNSLTIIAIRLPNGADEAMNVLDTLEMQPFCPSEAWILDVE